MIFDNLIFVCGMIYLCYIIIKSRKIKKTFGKFEKQYLRKDEICDILLTIMVQSTDVKTMSKLNKLRDVLLQPTDIRLRKLRSELHKDRGNE